MNLENFSPEIQPPSPEITPPSIPDIPKTPTTNPELFKNPESATGKILKNVESSKKVQERLEEMEIEDKEMVSKELLKLRQKIEEIYGRDESPSQRPPQVAEKYRSERVGKINTEEPEHQKEEPNPKIETKTNEDARDNYEILGISKNASKEEIKDAYFRLAKEEKKHPDLGGDEAEFKEINKAFDELYNKVDNAENDTGFTVVGGKRYNGSKAYDSGVTVVEQGDQDYKFSAEYHKYWEGIAGLVGTGAVKALKKEADKAVKMTQEAKNRRDEATQKVKKEYLGKKSSQAAYEVEIIIAENIYQKEIMAAQKMFSGKLQEALEKNKHKMRRKPSRQNF